MKSAAMIAAAFLLITVVSAQAATVQFDKSWKEQRFSLFSSNDFDLKGETLGVRSSGTVSMLWTRVPPALWPTRNASWQWQVRKGVPATDLTLKGGDDRDLALYFVFLPKQVAARMQDAAVLDLMDAPGVRILMYVWGGKHSEGQILPTPYLGERGRTIIRRAAGTGAEDEAADSDDTDTSIDASLSRLRLLP